MVFISDATQTSAANTQITTTINALSSTTLSLNTNSLTSEQHAQDALAAVNSAISLVSAQRGAIGHFLQTDIRAPLGQSFRSATNPR